MITFRPARMGDLDACARVCFEAFQAIGAEHNFPLLMPTVEAVRKVLAPTVEHPGFYIVVAERDGKIIGMNRMDERSSIAGIGPLAVDPADQDHGVGKMLMEHFLERCDARGCAGVRLVQAAYNSRSLALYTRLGFVVREPLAGLTGQVIDGELPVDTVRSAVIGDLGGCNEVCIRVHGFSRTGELQDAIQQGTVQVVTRAGRITGYTTRLDSGGHAVGLANADVQALIAARPDPSSAFLLPTRNAELFRRCLEDGMRVLHPWTLMSRGVYNEPQGPFLPSILY